MNIAQKIIEAHKLKFGILPPLQQCSVRGSALFQGEVVNKFTQDSTLSNDAVLENDVIGLTRCAEIVNSNLQKFELTNTVDFEQLKLVADYLRSLQTLMIKTSAIMK